MTRDERASRPTAAPPIGQALALVLGVFVASLAKPALSQPSSAATTLPDDFLVWQAPVGCSTAAAIRERVSELIGQPEIERERVRRVEGKVSQTRDGWELYLTLVGAFGKRERRLASVHCADLAEAAAVAISLAFDAARARQRAETVMPEAADAKPDTPGPVTPVGPDRPRAARVEPPSSDPSALSAWVGAELWLDASALPATAGGVSVLGALQAADLRLGVFAAWLPGVERSVAPGQSVSFSLLLGGVRACHAVGHGLVDTALCAGFEAGRLTARGASLLAARSANDLWLAPQVGLELGAELGSRLVVHLRADAFAPLLRQGYAVNETDDVHHVVSLGVRAAAGILVGF